MDPLPPPPPAKGGENSLSGRRSRPSIGRATPLVSAACGLHRKAIGDIGVGHEAAGGLAGGQEAFLGNFPCDAVTLHLVLQAAFDRRRQDSTGADRVARDGGAGDFEGDGSGEADERSLGGDVVDALGGREVAVDRGHVDDAAPSPATKRDGVPLADCHQRDKAHRTTAE